MSVRIAVLALQGAFIEHEKMLSKLGIASFEIRQKKDLLHSFDGLIIPGGESTVQGKLLKELDLLESIRQLILEGLPSFYTAESFGTMGKIPMTFIRAPYIKDVSDSVVILATVNSKIVAARQGNQLVTAFHPELNDDLTVHRYFIKICGGEQLNRIID